MHSSTESERPSDKASIAVRNLTMRRHVRFLIELFLLALLSAALWYALGPGDLDPRKYPPSYVSSDYREAFNHAWFRFLILLVTGTILLTIIYYGTSYAVTPFRIFEPFLDQVKRLASTKRRESSESMEPVDASDKTQEPDVGSEELLDRMADADVMEIADDETVSAILRTSAHSSAKLAGKMERRINTHLILGVLVGGAGLVVWWMSFYYGTTVSDKNLDLSHFLMGTLPRITILLFIEVLAGFFLRQYRIGVEDLKYFLELRRRADAKRIAYSILDRLDDKDAKREFAKTLMEEKSDTRLVSGETTTTLNAIDKEQNEIIKGLEVLGTKLEAVTKAFKKEA